MHHRPPAFRGRRRRGVVALLALLTCALGLSVPAAHAADRGVGFGTWAPLSSTGWHGSMRVGSVETYCIHPGLPTPTGTTSDRGVSHDANGLSPQQLVSINHLVSTYGQTDDPVQAASVGWAVKAIADRETTLHSWGYTGDSLPEAIHWILRRVTPENSAAIQQRTEQYLAEALAVPVPRVGGALTLTTDSQDPTRGTVVADVDPTATGSLRLAHAVFADTGRAERTDVRGGVVYPIISAHPDGDTRPYSVAALGTFSVATAAVHHFTTTGQQETAGPAEPTTFELSAQDATPRPVLFTPRLTTEAHIDADTFVDEVDIFAHDSDWARTVDGTFVTITATADVYRTGAYPAEAPDVPAGLTPVTQLHLVTDPSRGPGIYTVQGAEPLPGPGVYTAVWHIAQSEQSAESAPHLPNGYRWQEKFAEPTQTEQIVPPAPSPSPTSTPAPTPVIPVDDAPPPSPATASLAATGTPLTEEQSAGLAVGATLLVGTGLALLTRRRARLPR